MSGRSENVLENALQAIDGSEIHKIGVHIHHKGIDLQQRHRTSDKDIAINSSYTHVPRHIRDEKASITVFHHY